MKVLIVDGGARGQALAWLALQSSRVKEVCVAPGNGGTFALSKKLGKKAYNAAIHLTDIAVLIELVKKERFDLVVVGAEDALAAGIVDKMQKYGIPVFGPTQEVARLESSKKYGREMAFQAGISIPSYVYFDDCEKACRYVQTCSLPVVIKVNCLAGGKGVKICYTIKEAYGFLNRVMSEWGPGAVLIEEYLGTGPELSGHAFCDKNGNIFMLPLSQDHKRVFDNDKGDNTGGMGAYAPVPWANDYLRRVQHDFIEPIVDYLMNGKNSFVGCLYPGLIFDQKGKLKLLEFNVRPGDPEWEAIARLWNTKAMDFIDVLEMCITGNLDKMGAVKSLKNSIWHSGYSICVMMVSHGYPNEYKTGFPIYGIEEAEKVPGVEIFHAGTAYQENQLVTAGGRVLAVTALANTLIEANFRVYQAVSLIKAKGMKFHYRTDIVNCGNY